MLRSNLYSVLAVCLAVPCCLAVPTLDAQNSTSSSGGATQASLAVSTGSSQPQLQQRYPRYKIQNQDALLLSFPLSPELNQTVTVQPDGYINLQNAGSLYVQGMTVPEVVAALKKTYATTLHEPIIDVDLKDFQKPYFVAFGQVGKPGQYDLRATATPAVPIVRARL